MSIARREKGYYPKLPWVTFDLAQERWQASSRVIYLATCRGCGWAKLSFTEATVDDIRITSWIVRSAHSYDCSAGLPLVWVELNPGGRGSRSWRLIHRMARGMPHSRLEPFA